MQNFAEYFRKAEKEEGGEVYIQNTSPGTVSMQFGSGDNVHTFSLPRKRDPIILTNHVPFDMIKSSMDFRKLASRQPPVIKLLCRQEYDAYYGAKAETLGVTAAQAEAQAEMERQAAKTLPSVSAKIEEPAPTEEPAQIEDIVHPRVVHLLHQASDSIPEGERMPTKDLLSELQDLSMEFKVADFEYIQATTKAAAIRKWAAGQIKTLSTNKLGE